MSAARSTEVLVQIVELLTPLSSEERQRVISASLAFLGENAPQQTTHATSDGLEENIDSQLSPRARNWIKQNSLTMEALEQVFHFNGGEVEVIASDVPGKSDKEKTYNAYILVGVSKLLSTGEANFDDKQARELCKMLGCLNEANHSAYMKNKGNELAGSKEKGWTLTAPGLKQGAALIQALNKS
jgi:hypothetical protein